MALPPTPSRRLHILAFPEELQVLILTDLDIDDLLACQQTCTSLSKVVKDAPELQYKIALRRVALVEAASSPSEKQGIATRLKALRAYQTFFESSDISTIPRNKSGHRLHCAGDVIVYQTQDAGGVISLTITQPGFSPGGIAAQEWVVNLGNCGTPFYSINSCAVDVAQDLLVVTTLELGEMAQCWLLSISQNGVAHPLARAPRFEPVAELNPSIDVWDRVQICGDLIAWSIIGESTDLTVYNWKTGREIWQDGYYDEDEPGFEDLWCYILDSTHVLKMESTVLTVNEIDPQSVSTVSKRWCRLELPIPANGVGAQDVKCYIQHPSTPIGGQLALLHDPDTTVLALKCINPNDASESSPVLIVVPIATLVKQLESVPEGPNGTPALPWEQWGVEGARILSIPRGYVGVSTLGSLCAVSVISATALSPSEATGLKRSEMKVHVFDLHKYVLPRPGQLQDTGDEIDVGSVINRPCAFAGPVQARFPYRAFCKTVVLEGADATQPSAAFLMASGLYHMTCSSTPN